MFATIQDLYIRFGRENVLSAANFDALDTTDPASIPVIETRIAYFLQQAYDLLANALRQGSYDPDGFSAPYPATLVNANSEIAFMQIYRTRHSEDETTPDAYKTIEDNNFRLVRDIQGGAVRFAADIARAKSFPAVTRPGYAATPQKTMPPARVNGILPDRNGNIVIDEYVKATVFDSYKNAPYLAIAGKTYVDVDTGRVGWCYVGVNGTNLFVTITGGGGSGGTNDYRDLLYKPMINGVVVSGEQTGADLGLASTFFDEGGGTTLDLKDVFNIVQTQIEAEQIARESGDSQTLQSAKNELTSYRTAANQDTIDNAIKSDKVSKSLFTDSTVNPNGFVLLWIVPNFTADVVNVDYGAVKPTTGQFTQGNIALPFSDESKAGLMSKEQAAALTQAVSDIGNLTAGAGFKEQWFDTRAELVAAETSSFVSGMPTVVWNDEGQGGATTKWQYAPDDTSGRLKLNGFIYGGIAQEVPYQAATTTTLGLVKSSTISGKGNVEPDGVISVEGWDALVARVATLETALQQQLNFNTTHDHSGGAMGAVTPKDFTVYPTDAQAQADTTGNLALSPIQ